MDYQKRADLEDRTMNFARDVRTFIRKMPEASKTFMDATKLMEASAGIGASYLEANEAHTAKEFMYLIHRCLKEAKYSLFWLRILEKPKTSGLAKEHERLHQEANELFRIFCAIVKKVNQKTRASAAKPVAELQPA